MSKHQKAGTKKLLKRILRVVLLFLGVFFLYVGIVLIHGTATDFQPEAEIDLTLESSAPEKVVADTATLRFLCWNIGYAGLGKESNFFYEEGGMLRSKGKMVRPEKSIVEKNMKQILSMLSNYKDAVDFVLLQEVDRKSKRSYFINEYEQIANLFNNYQHSFALNYKAARVPIPILEPWKAMGKVESGLASFGRFEASKATRYQFPGKYGWPTRIFQLDRCMLVQRYPVSNGKELLVINSHNSAYDGGKLKKEEMAFLKSFVKAEYKKGNYVVVAADWNQCPPNFRADKFPGMNMAYYPGNIDADFMGYEWLWAADYTTVTNRANSHIYDAKNTATTLIDFYLLSPNLKLKGVKGISNGFECSDHQPVWMEIELTP